MRLHLKVKTKAENQLNKIKSYHVFQILPNPKGIWLTVI